MRRSFDDAGRAVCDQVAGFFDTVPACSRSECARLLADVKRVLRAHEHALTNGYDALAPATWDILNDARDALMDIFNNTDA